MLYQKLQLFINVLHCINDLIFEHQSSSRQYTQLREKRFFLPNQIHRKGQILFFKDAKKKKEGSKAEYTLVLWPLRNQSLYSTITSRGCCEDEDDSEFEGEGPVSVLAFKQACLFVSEAESSSGTCIERTLRMNYWSPKTLSQRLSLKHTTNDLLSTRQSSSYHSRPLSFVFKCHFLVTCPSFNNFNSLKMAPRNLTQTVVENGNQEDCSDLALGKCYCALLHRKTNDRILSFSR